MAILIEVNEKSTQSFNVIVKDDAGDAVVPTVATYTLTTRDGTIVDEVDGLAITPSTLMKVILAGDNLEILDQTNEREYRLLTIETDRGDIAKPENLQTPFWVKNLKVIA